MFHSSHSMLRRLGAHTHLTAHRRHHDLRGFALDAAQLARRHPAILIASGAFILCGVAGLLVAQHLRRARAAKLDAERLAPADFDSDASDLDADATYDASADTDSRYIGDDSIEADEAEGSPTSIAAGLADASDEREGTSHWRSRH